MLRDRQTQKAWFFKCTQIQRHAMMVMWNFLLLSFKPKKNQKPQLLYRLAFVMLECYMRVDEIIIAGVPVNYGALNPHRNKI